jgi:hypothetical protein
MGDCIDVSSSPTNCGSIGNRCNMGQTCLMGSCVSQMACRGMYTLCSGACVSTDSNVRHCGRCGNTCDGEQVCVSGQCRDYLAPAGCTTCPCACAMGFACCPAPVGAAGVCVEGGACPVR